MPIGEAFLATSLAMSELGRRYGMQRDVEKLQRARRRLRAMLCAAEQMKVEGQLFTLWLQELKHLDREAEDVVDELEYEDLRNKALQSRESSGDASVSLPSTSKQVRELSLFPDPHVVLFNDRMAQKIDEICGRLEEIAKDKADLAIGGTWSDVGMIQPEFKGQMRETSSLLVDPEVFGRIKERDMLKTLLLGTTDGGSSSSSSEVHPTDLSVISLVGMGGLGKTTLAQWVYNNEQVQEYFHPRIWVHVALDFDLKRVTKQILEHLTDDTQSGLQNLDNFNVLQQSLTRKLKGRRFLIVLDDVWEADHMHTTWRNFSAPLTHGEKGSRILVTTRSAKVADMVLSVKKIELEVLSFDDCWSIFKRHAFPDGNSDEHPNLEPIGKQIVRKLGGVPLAVTIIGGVLRFALEESSWMNVLQNELWELQQGGGDLLAVLRLSYGCLPHHLKQCFTYLSVYPKGSEFGILVAVQLWMAQGYISPRGKKSVEEVGRDCFNELFNRSLIQLVNQAYVIHDLLHDLGRLILQHDFFEIDSRHDHCEIDSFKPQSIPEDASFICHLRLEYDRAFLTDLLGVLCQFKSLRTFLLIDYSWFYVKKVFQAPVGLFYTMKCLRVMHLCDSGIELLPDSISCLTHLRFLDLSRTPIKYLPESLCTLYKLETLYLDECDQLNILPKGMSNLISLHYLIAKHELVSNIARIGKLIHLQSLEVFSVSEENGNKIGELKGMNELRGQLRIRNLHRVGSREDAFEATLKNKLHLEALELEWADDRGVDQIDPKCEESVIEGLQPPPQLKELSVNYYAGITSPSWMNSISISGLEYFCLDKCTNLNHLPPFWQLKSLKTLAILNCPLIKELPQLPTALVSLFLQGLWLKALPNNLHDLPLEQIVIGQIPELKELPLLPATLKELALERVGLESLPEVCQGHELSILKIRGCLHLTTLQRGPLQHRMRRLRVLSITDCVELVDWPEADVLQATLRTLDEELSIERCPKLKPLPEGSELHPSLKKFVVKAWPGGPNKLLLNQLHNFNSDDVSVEQQYRNLAHCADEALQHILAVDSLQIEYLQEEDDNELAGTDADVEESPPPSSPPVYFKYNRQETLGWECKGNYMARRVTLEIEGGRRRGRHGVDVDAGVTAEDDSCKLLCTCLGGHVWTSSLRHLTLSGIPDRAFIGRQHICRPERGPGGRGGGEEEGYEWGDGEALPHHPPLRLPLLETLNIENCTEMRRLPTELLLYHLPALAIYNCPELTWSSVEEGIRSLPSLQQLQIYNCPKLRVMPLPSPLLNNGGGTEDAAALSPPPALRLSGQPPLLRHLYTDDTSLLMRGSFLNQFLTSLQCLWISNSELTSLTADEEEGLRTLASSLRYLGFHYCPDLEHLPRDLRALLPNLKFLQFRNCPKIRCLPNEGTPATVEYLSITGCPVLTERCHPRPSIRGAMEDGDWHKMAHVSVIDVNGLYLRGSFSKHQELEANWDFIH